MPAPGSALTPVTPVFLVDLFPELHAELMSLLRAMRPDDWGKPTACALWSVKDIVAHLLDGALRRLSYGRDRMEPAPDRPITSYAELALSRSGREFCEQRPATATRSRYHITPQLFGLQEDRDRRGPGGARRLRRVRPTRR